MEKMAIQTARVLAKEVFMAVVVFGKVMEWEKLDFVTAP
jgi:hypothetical protein